MIGGQTNGTGAGAGIVFSGGSNSTVSDLSGDINYTLLSHDDNIKNICMLQ